MWPPHWAPPQPHPLVPLPEHLPPIPSISPSWQMSKCSEQGEIANNRIKVAKHEQLHARWSLCVSSEDGTHCSQGSWMIMR